MVDRTLLIKIIGKINWKGSKFGRKGNKKYRYEERKTRRTGN